ncbi:MAG: PEP-CTERM sorting domain-containing protein [Verrucomicrobia bacterium]|nr:PEP-CTERM sorting domain-containing protein [Verrucomicrobiota bacterium]
MVADSHYGTNDQAGNVWEWNDAVPTDSSRGLRGGSWYNAGLSFLLASTACGINVPATESNTLGFRVATVPEPGCAVLTLLAGGWVALLGRRRR